MASTGGREIEIKLAVADAAAGRAILRRAGFHVSRRRVFENNTVFDTAQRTLRVAGALLVQTPDRHVLDVSALLVQTRRGQSG